jgi:SSS family solute:Na+ symporter
VLRVQNKTIIDFGIVPVSNRNRLFVAVANALFALAIALKGSDSLIGLIVSFYAVYLAAVFVPFIAYLAAQTGYYTFSGMGVRLSLSMGSISACSMLILTLINPAFVIFSPVELSIMTLGIGFGILGLFIGQIIDKYFPASPVREEI